MTHPNLIGGQWRDSAASRADVNPSNTADIVGRYAAADADQAREAVAAAAEAAAGWAATPPVRRGEILDRGRRGTAGAKRGAGRPAGA